jgi:predicted RNase H-like nuclease (RuvC/YqgF family)
MIARPEESEESRRLPPVQVPGEDDSLLKQHTLQIADKIGSGIDALTRGRMEGVERFGQAMHTAVGSLKEDLRTTMRDREHGSIKQLENSKDTFQGNIQQFKRKAASMHQSLLGFEADARGMTGKLTDIQRRVRKEMQQQRIDLENELKKLRKMLRRQNHGGESDDFDDEDVSPPPKR